MQRSVQAAPKRWGLRRRAVPRPLAVLLLIVVTVGLAWALVVPPFQAPDEPTHFAYVQSLAESFTLPNVPGRPGLSSDETAADASVGAIRGGFYPAASPPSWSAGAEQAYLALEHGAHPPSRSDGSGVTTSTGNPPLYYLLASVPYLIDHGGSAFGRLYAIRIAGVLLLMLTALAAWLLAGEVFGHRRLPQLICASVAGLLPMSSFIVTAVTPDALLITTWTFALWLAARVINGRARGRDAVALCAVTAAAVLTKATSYALVGPVALALLFGCLRRPAAERWLALVRSSAAALVLAVPVVAWLVFAPGIGGVAITHVASTAGHAFNFRQFLSYIWQFYLPRLPFLTPVPPMAPQIPVYAIWVRQLTGDFGWLVVSEPAWMYPLAAAAAALLAIGVILRVARLRGRRQLALLTVFGLTALALLVLLHFTGYQALITGSGVFLQGRYLLPAIGLLGLAVGLVIVRMPLRVQGVVCGVTVSGLLAWQAVSLAAVLHAYYL